MNRNLLFLVPVAITCSIAQAAETGAVRGQVLDESGTPIPGATVVITGADVAGERVVTTDAKGEFRMLSLSPGPKNVMVKKEGFAPTRYNVIIRLDETAFVPVTLKLVGGAGEEIIIEETMPVVDTTRTAVSTQMTTELLANVPVGRSYQSAVNMVAGVSGRVDTQNGGPSTGNPSVRGEGQYGNNYMVDGISTRDPSTNTFGSNVNFDAIQEIQVYTDGYPAEFSNATGMLVNVVTKDGGNEHFGSAGYFTELPASGGEYDIYNAATGEVEATEKRDFWYNELSLTAGGPVIKDKLWYFASISLNNDTVQYEALPPETPYVDRGLQGLAKLTWFITPDLSVQYQISPSFSNTSNYETGGLYATEAQATREDNSMNHIVTTRWRPSEMNELELKATGWRTEINVVPSSGVEGSDEFMTPAVRDENGYYTGNYDSADYNTRQRAGVSLKYTQLVNDFLGDHKFKLGAELFRTASSRELVYTGGSMDSALNADGTADDGAVADYLAEGYGYGYLLYGDAASGYPCTPEANYTDCAGYRQSVNVGPLSNTADLLGFFLQDDWTFKPITLNLGARLDHESLQQNAGTTIMDSWMIAPRLGLAWDVTQDSKTLFSVNAGRYYDNAGTTFSQWANTRSANIYREYAADGEGGYDLVWEQNPTANPLVYCTEESLDQLVSLGSYTQEDADAIWKDYCDESELRPHHMDKVVVGLKREIVPLFALGLKGIYSKTTDLAEDIDYDYATWVVANPENKFRMYRALELTAERKYDGVWQLLASYTLSEAKGHMPGQSEISSGGQTGSSGNEVGVYLDDINDPQTRTDFYGYGYGWFLDGLAGLGREGDESYYGYLPYHSFHSAKLAGSYTLPFGTTIGAVYEFDSGHAWQKRGYVALYGDYFSFPEGRGTRFMPPVHYINLRAAHKFEFGSGNSVEGAVDVFNVPDFETPITYYENEGDGFGSPMYRQSPRAIRVGLTYTY